MKTHRIMDIDNKKEKAWWVGGLVLFGKLSAWIAAPVVIGAFAGKYLDRRYESEPWLFLISVGAAFFISMIALISSTLAEYKKIEEESNSKKNHKND